MKNYKTFLEDHLVEGILGPNTHAAHDLELHPHEKMKHESESGLDWEYNREVQDLAPQHIKNAFSSREDFGQKYRDAPVQHLTPDEHMNLEYSEHSSFMPKYPGHNRLDDVQNHMGHRRDVGRISNDIDSGKTAYPIVIKHSRGVRILAGNTRMSVGASKGLSIPVKMMDIRDTEK